MEIDSRKGEGSRRQKINGSFCFEALGKREAVGKKPEPQSLPPPSVRRRELSRVKQNIRFGPTKASKSFKLLFVSGTMLGIACNKMWVSDY